MSIKPVRSVLDLMPILSRGRFVERVDQHLTAAVEHLESLPDQKGKATVTITLTVAYQEGRTEVVPDVKSKLPPEKSFTGTPFWIVDGGFSVQHPSQDDMFAGPRAVRDRDFG
ncbi:hypothetical protein [Methylobacterium oryzihabitans]|uniref:Uncharacterized protein n=1 Tax=Methylobacterium oryzihabitans TaxID=2499852 RepID=A0A3S2XHT9_9HYPH|nr:hypothetical protein [Methylobacterium oryzihabitans]RVU15208.1 hypothetical protein EOE48_20590 [Methylobacterium oryzihabitans]